MPRTELCVVASLRRVHWLQAVQTMAFQQLDIDPEELFEGRYTPSRCSLAGWIFALFAVRVWYGSDTTAFQAYRRRRSI